MTPKMFFRWVAWLLVLAITIFTVAPIEFRPVSGAPVSLERFGAFVVIGTMFCLGYPGHRLRIIVMLIGIITLLEVTQNYVPNRHGRLPDGMVKVSGALIGAAFASLLTRGKRTL
ncbi:VanZ family protein [Microvirga calopogonii]|uniref:VanZ family protein n=1 Tax=Microvirga calopogonii TaxID=2078013 RepID=UPI000E0DA5DA|nr:VanZ family protein [Microvirga calopogonii]